MNTNLRWICGLVVAFALGLLVEARLKKNTVQVEVMATGRLLLHPDKGDRIAWKDEQGHTVKVKFSRKACSETPDIQGLIDGCTVNVDAGTYPYRCENDRCTDPGVGVGSIVILGGDRTGAVAKQLPDPDPQTVYCDPDHGNTVAGDAVTATVNNTLEWRIGDGTVGSGWKITVADGTCKDGTTSLAPGQVCTIKQGAASQTYQIKGSSCAVPNGNGTLTIQ